jgi:hypothetical protein
MEVKPKEGGDSIDDQISELLACECRYSAISELVGSPVKPGMRLSTTT